MSNEPRDTIAQALADEFDLGLDEQVVESSRVDVNLQSAADAVLAALQTGGWELVKPSEPDEDGNFHWSRNYVFVDDDGLIMTKHGTTFGDAQDVREVVSAFLGAAIVSERRPS